MQKYSNDTGLHFIYFAQHRKEYMLHYEISYFANLVRKIYCKGLLLRDIKDNKT